MSALAIIEVTSKRISQCAFVEGARGFCLLSLLESRQNAGFRPELVVSAEAHVVDHGLEVAVQVEAHAPLVELPLGAAARDLHAPLGTDIGLAAQLLRTVLDHDLRPDERHIRVSFFVEICIDLDPHDDARVGVDCEFAVVVGLVLVWSGPITSGMQQYVSSGVILVLAAL